MSKIRVLVVDDSPTMRALLSNLLRRDPEIEVVGGAGDPYEAREAIKSLNPDVLTLDVEMPRMNGLEFLEKLMRLHPMPVVMVSTLTQEGAETTLDALELGAVDCIGKPTAGIRGEAFAELAAKVKSAARSRVRPAGDRLAASKPRQGFQNSGRIVAIGSSTGGVEALMCVLSTFPANCPPTVITQHMPPSFTRSLADRFNRSYAPEIGEAQDGAQLAEGRVYIAPGGDRHLEIVSGAHGPRCRLKSSPPINGHRPSVDALFRSVAATKLAAVGVILTGMGKDGAEGLLAMRQAGAETIGQDEASCVVYGMPKAAFSIGAVGRQLSLERIGGAILERCALPLTESA